MAYSVQYRISIFKASTKFFHHVFTEKLNEILQLLLSDCDNRIALNQPFVIEKCSRQEVKKKFFTDCNEESDV